MRKFQNLFKTCNCNCGHKKENNALINVLQTRVDYFLWYIRAITTSSNTPLFVYTRTPLSHATLIGCWRQFQPDSFVGRNDKKAHPNWSKGIDLCFLSCAVHPILLLVTDDFLVGCWRHVTVVQGHKRHISSLILF